LNKKKIKIYSLATTYPESLDSKKPKFVHLINKELAKFGFQVKTITPHSKNALVTEEMDSVLIRRFKFLPEKHELNYSSIPDEIRRTKFGYFKVMIMCLTFFWVTFFECLREKPDIIHAHWAFPCGVIAYFMSFFFHSKFIVTIHGGEIPFVKKFKLLKRIVVTALNKSVLVCANSNYSKNEYVKMGVNPDKIITLFVPASFVKHSHNLSSVKIFREKYADTSEKIVLFCGRLVERKGVEYLIKAIKELSINNVHLIIVGGGEMLEKLQSLTNSLGLDDKISFAGRASDEELGIFHDISNVFVCPSIIDSQGNTEYLGLVIPEAMESKLPVIASSVGGIVDIIKNEENGLLVHQKDPSSLARAIERIISDEKFRMKLVENSKKTVNEFSSTIIGKKYYEIFQNCLN